MKVVMGLNNGLHNVPVRIEPGQPFLAPPPFNNSNNTSCRMVGPRGKVSYKVIAGPGRQNTTVLASCSAAGNVFPPLIVFPGKTFNHLGKVSSYNLNFTSGLNVD